jgi:hypothetical protein
MEAGKAFSRNLRLRLCAFISFPAESLRLMRSMPPFHLGTAMVATPSPMTLVSATGEAQA